VVYRSEPHRYEASRHIVGRVLVTCNLVVGNGHQQLNKYNENPMCEQPTGRNPMNQREICRSWQQYRWGLPGTWRWRPVCTSPCLSSSKSLHSSPSGQDHACRPEPAIDSHEDTSFLYGVDEMQLRSAETRVARVRGGSKITGPGGIQTLERNGDDNEGKSRCAHLRVLTPLDV
jgi:hypothetical protein